MPRWPEWPGKERERERAAEVPVEHHKHTLTETSCDIRTRHIGDMSHAQGWVLIYISSAVRRYEAIQAEELGEALESTRG